VKQTVDLRDFSVDLTGATDSTAKVTAALAQAGGTVTTVAPA
jgi:ADP-ribosylglycohydrolase